jgi:hypothetical protein
LHDYKSNVRVGGGVAAMADVAYSLSEEVITTRTLSGASLAFTLPQQILDSKDLRAWASQVRADQAWET